MNIKELKMNLILLGFEAKAPGMIESKNIWSHPEIKTCYIRFHFHQVVYCKLKIDNRDTMQPILDRVIKKG